MMLGRVDLYEEVGTYAIYTYPDGRNTITMLKCFDNHVHSGNMPLKFRENVLIYSTQNRKPLQNMFGSVYNHL